MLTYEYDSVKPRGERFRRCAAEQQEQKDDDRVQRRRGGQGPGGDLPLLPLLPHARKHL